MMTETLLTTTDTDEWRRILPIGVSVFGSVEYAAIVEKHSGYHARLYVLDTENARVAYPFFLRPIRSLPFALELEVDCWDLLTPEYTGPRVVYGALTASDFSFPAIFSAFCRNHGIVTEFAHLHPWQQRDRLLDTNAVTIDREIIYVDVMLSPDQLWDGSYSHACRKNINRARREKVHTLRATDIRDIQEFLRIYTHTMTRNKASAQYLFSLEYFAAFFETMPDNARFVLAEYQNQIVAGTLYLYDDQDVYSYLGGAVQEFQHIRPTNMVVHDTIQWAHDCGKQRLILGGGYHIDDGIFRFKSSFSPLRANFQVYRRVHLPELYDRLCDWWSAHYGASLDIKGYFPGYRSQPVVVPIPGIE